MSKIVLLKKKKLIKIKYLNKIIKKFMCELCNKRKEINVSESENPLKVNVCVRLWAEPLIFETKSVSSSYWATRKNIKRNYGKYL